MRGFGISVDSPRELFLELLYGGIGVQNRGQNGAGMVMGEISVNTLNIKTMV